MKIKRYNIEQLKRYSVVLSPEEQSMLLGGNQFKDGIYGVSVFDDNGRFMMFIRYDDLNTIHTSQLQGYITPTDLVQCKGASDTYFLMRQPQGSDFFHEYQNFTDGFTNEMIQGLEQYRVEVTFFEGEEASNYKPNYNMVFMNTNRTDLMARSHEVVHSFQNNVFHRSMNSDEKMNLEYQAYVVSILFAKGKGQYDSMIDEFRWMDPFIVDKGNGNFYVKKGIFAELNSHDVDWSLSNTGLHYSTNDLKEGEEALTLQPNYNYNWEVLLKSLGIKVQ